jgi:hypothetical protein
LRPHRDCQCPSWKGCQCQCSRGRIWEPIAGCCCWRPHRNCQHPSWKGCQCQYSRGKIWEPVTVEFTTAKIQILIIGCLQVLNILVLFINLNQVFLIAILLSVCPDNVMDLVAVPITFLKSLFSQI